MKVHIQPTVKPVTQPAGYRRFQRLGERVKPEGGLYAGYIQGRVILQFRDEKVRVVFEGGLYSRAGSVTGFTLF